MAGKNRKDHRGRVLPPNVSQKADKRYIWRKMIDGRKYVLTDNDLNELKKKIIQKESELQNGIYSKNLRLTLNEWDLFIRARKAQENRHFQTIRPMLWYKFGTQSL